MRTSLSASFFLTLGLFASIGVSFFLTQDWDASGLDLESSASGDESEDDSTTDIILEDNRHRDVIEVPSDMGIINSGPGESEWIFWDNSKSFLEIPEIRAGVIVGGVIGALLAVAVTAVLIYKWQNNEKEQYIF